VIYGTAWSGGGTQGCNTTWSEGCGTVFALQPPGQKRGKWAEKTLHRFQNAQDGANPAAGVILDKKGKLYGTTFTAGSEDGVVFCLSPPSGKSHSWTETELHIFVDKHDGGEPDAGLVFDTHGNLYGTGTADSYSHGGLVFMLKPPAKKRGNWTLKPLYGFEGSPDGAHPDSNLVFDKRGNLYGTTQWGGVGTTCQGGCGTVFEVSP
jgi:hypothetical protein